MSSVDPKNPRDNESFKEKLNEKLEKLKNNDQVEGLFSYAKSNTKDTIAYIFLILGIILLFFDPPMQHYGAFLIGLIVGFYFSDEIMYVFQHFNDLIDEQGLVRVLVLAALTVTFFIMVPFIFLGTILGAIIIRALAPNNK